MSGSAFSPLVYQLREQVLELRKRSRQRATDTQAQLDNVRSQLRLAVGLHLQTVLLLVAKGVCADDEAAPLVEAANALLDATRDEPFDWGELDADGRGGAATAG